MNIPAEIKNLFSRYDLALDDFISFLQYFCTMADGKMSLAEIYEKIWKHDLADGKTQKIILFYAIMMMATFRIQEAYETTKQDKANIH